MRDAHTDTLRRNLQHRRRDARQLLVTARQSPPARRRKRAGEQQGRNACAPMDSSSTAVAHRDGRLHQRPGGTPTRARVPNSVVPTSGAHVAAVWSRLHSRRGCRQRACHPQRRGRHRVSGCSWYLPGTTSAEKQKNILSMQMSAKTGAPARKCRVRKKTLPCLACDPIPVRARASAPG